MNLDPEVFKHIELLLGSIGFIMALFFASILIVTKEQRVKANMFLAIYLFAFSLRIGKSLFYNYFPIHPIIRNVFLGMLLAIGPSLWFYVTHLCKPNIEIRRGRVLMHYIPVFLFVLFCWLIPNDYSQLSRVIFMGLLAHILLYGIFTLYWLSNKSDIQFGNKSRKINNWLLYFTFLTIAMSLMQIGVFLRIVPYLSTAFLFSVVIIFLSVWALNNPWIFKIRTEKYMKSPLNNEKSLAYLNQLNSLMDHERLFLDPDLTLVKLSAKLGITSKQLSQVINQTKNENYSQYIASYRITEAKRLLLLPEYKNYKISAIAYESGFNSISSFNAAFKKITHTTAIQYRQSAIK
ncbi:helix-turn-helix domain-containing protein [Aquimarina sp. 2304DJ70-9]|uniref:helix-turn-helix domain-containing protein n=1 Tax=Aquimarina penaris TaxID=3231044 RepID=UPI003462751A